MGENAFAAMATSMVFKPHASDKKISVEDYNRWRHEFVFDALSGIRYGQSFCNRFDITDSIVFYERDIKWLDQYIQNNYVSNDASNTYQH